MKRFLLALAIFMVVPLGLHAQQAAPDIPFDSVPNAVKLPTGMYLGEVSGVAVNSKGHIFIFTRGNTTGPAYAASAAQLLEFDRDGKYIREIGRNLYAWSFAHMVRIDKDDNIWAADKGSDMVIKFNPSGRVDMVFGRKLEASDEGTGPLKHPNPPLPAETGRFRQVTDVAWDSDDNVADRTNRRIQVFNTKGEFIRQIHMDIAYDPNTYVAIGDRPTGNALLSGNMAPGSPWAVAISPGPKQYLFAADAYPGRIYKMTLDGEVVGVLGESGKKLGQFGWIHEMIAVSETELYVAEILNWRVQKLILHPS